MARKDINLQSSRNMKRKVKRVVPVKPKTVSKTARQGRAKRAVSKRGKRY